jgi:hypothetical protein
MKQAITGVAPPELGEVTIMTVWPTIGAGPAGRLLGRMCSIGGSRNPFALGKLFCLFPGIPWALLLFAVSLLPPIPFAGFFNRRYRLTNRRVVELQDKLIWKTYRPLRIPVPFNGIEYGHATKTVDLDRFDAIDIVVLPGQAWFPAGDLIFRKGNVETLRLSGVSRPETFRETCLKAQRAYVGVKKALARR